MRDGEVTRLLGADRGGEPQAEARLTDLTYRELRKIATAASLTEKAGINWSVKSSRVKRRNSKVQSRNRIPG